MSRSKTVFVCQQCGSQTPRWQGRCPECGTWNSLTEETFAPSTKASAAAASSGRTATYAKSASLYSFEGQDGSKLKRLPSGFQEVDRVLGGGFVPGSLLLFGGEPGIGKSTLLLQIAAKMSEQGKSCLYVSGEESGPQVAARARRLQVPENERLQFLATTDLEEAKVAIESSAPDFIVADSVQTLASKEFESAAGTVSQVREVAQIFMDIAKGRNIVTLLVGHVTKEGSIAGPRLLEHMVDGVFYFELAASGAFRLLRGQKNRFGPTHELAVFEMASNGLQQVDNPSARFLAERSREMPGSAVVAHLEGSRPFLTEVQALTQRCYQGFPRRTVQGVNQNRVSVLLAVLEKSLQVPLSEFDVYCKVASGAQIEEPAADLPLLFALLSASIGKALPADLLLIGEVGLGGELRSVSGMAARLSEGKSVGLTRAVVPAWCAKEAKEVKGIEVFPAKTLADVRKIVGI